MVGRCGSTVRRPVPGAVGRVAPDWPIAGNSGEGASEGGSLGARFRGRMIVGVVLLAAACALLAPGVGAAARAGEPVLVTPRAGEASFGEVIARGPAGAREAVLLVGGRWAGRVAIAGDGEARFQLREGRAAGAGTGATPAVGPQTVAVRFLAGTRVLGTVAARGVWLLPGSGAVARPAGVRDAALSERLEQLGRAFPGWAGLYVQDLVTGRFGSYNADATFLAASTVKLGVLIEALRHYGPAPEHSSAWGDIAAMVTVSSNEAANRLLNRLGGGSDAAGSRLVDARFDTLGATSTRFPGPYRLEQAAAAAARAAIDAPQPTPFLPWRRTTAGDLGRIVHAIHAAATGDAAALSSTGLTRHEARLGLGLLLSARPAGGALAGALRPGLPVAEKTGYRDDIRNAAAIVYTASGPKIVVVLLYDPPTLDAGAAIRLAHGVTALAGVGR